MARGFFVNNLITAIKKDGIAVLFSFYATHFLNKRYLYIEEQKICGMIGNIEGSGFL